MTLTRTDRQRAHIFVLGRDGLEFKFRDSDPVGDCVLERVEVGPLGAKTDGEAREGMVCKGCGGFSSAQTCHRCNEEGAILKRADEIRARMGVGHG